MTALLTRAKHFQSSGQTPFGFAVRGPDLIVTEAFGGATDASAASSYELNRDGNLEVISPTVATTETSACWVVVTGSGRFAYTANTGSGTISGYRLGTDGALTLLNADGVTGITGANSSPADMTLSLDRQIPVLPQRKRHDQRLPRARQRFPVAVEWYQRSASRVCRTRRALTLHKFIEDETQQLAVADAAAFLFTPRDSSLPVPTPPRLTTGRKRGGHT
jgi:hypothetical protein